jgi:hypothetical protein
MANVDWNRPEHDLPREGWHFAKIEKCTFKKSKKGMGDEMFEVELVEADFGEKLVTDWIMLEGKMWGAGKHALIALGLEGKANIDEMDLVGKTAYVFIKHEPRTYFDNKTGKEVKKVDARVDKQATDPWCGYKPNNEIPDGFEPLAPF